MKKTILFITISIICALSTTAQITKQEQEFDDISVVEGKVAFIKEIDLIDTSQEEAYDILKKWGTDNYGRDPFISSVRYDSNKNPSKKEILAKSRIELILPENSKGIRDKMIMRYRIDGFIVDDKCVLQITELSFILENTKDKRLPRMIRAEDFITDIELAKEDDLQELKINTKKSTIYFINTLAKDLEKLFGY